MNWKEFHDRHEFTIDTMMFAFGMFGALGLCFGLMIIAAAIAICICF